MLANKLMSALSGDAEDKLYVDDVFSTYLYTGNGSTQKINNGIDLAGEGGLVWIKSRNTASSHVLVDSQRGMAKELYTNATYQEGVAPSDYSINSFNIGGFSLGKPLNQTNSVGAPYTSWAFRRAPKFFDVVTYTGNGVAKDNTQEISHTLGVVPGMIIAKAVNATSDWTVYHRGLNGNNFVLKLNTTDPQKNITPWGYHSATKVYFSKTMDATESLNDNGVQYVAYLFAHDDSEDGIIQCGSFTTDASGNATVNLGWEPQYVLMKKTNGTSDWNILDTMRGFPVDGSDTKWLMANQSSSELTISGPYVTSTGFKIVNNFSGNSDVIYLAIRRPNKPPKTGTEVYNAIARTGTGAAATVTGVGFAPDLIHSQTQNSWGLNAFITRLIGGGRSLKPPHPDPDDTNSSLDFGMDGFSSSYAWYTASNPHINHFFKRAPGFFDVVCYTGTGVARTVPHSLGVAPELMIVKVRSGGAGSLQWCVWCASGDPAKGGYLNTPDAFISYSFVNNGGRGLRKSTASSLDVDSVFLSATGSPYVAYLFATLPGISKVGSYTGNGTNQTIDCGFSTGARFFLVKATSTTGSWWVFDSARGIVSAFDPALQLNSTAAEITSADAVDPHPSGIIVNQEATCSINTTGVNYVYLAIS